MPKINGHQMRAVSNNDEAIEAVEDLREKVDVLDECLNEQDWESIKEQLDEIESVTSGLRAFAEQQKGT